MARRPRLNDGDLLRAWHALAAHERDSVALALQYFGRAAPEVPPADEEIAADTDQPLVAPRLEPPEPPLPAVAVEQQVFWRITEIQHEPSEEDPHPVESVDDAVFCSPPDAAPPPREVPLMASRAVMARCGATWCAGSRRIGWMYWRRYAGSRMAGRCTGCRRPGRRGCPVRCRW